MGSKYEVYEWYRDVTDGRGWCFRKQFQTEWLAAAIIKAWLLKINGAGCVKIEWR